MEKPPMDNQELIRENTLLRQKIQELEHLKVECKQMEKAMRESEERYSMLSQASFEGIIISEKGMILDANDQLANMLGYELSDLIGRDGFDLILPERRESFRQHILSGSESPSQIPVIRKDGSVLHVEMRTKAHHTEGRIVRLTALHDITDRLEAEEALQRSHAELERLVAVRTEELMRVNEKLRIEVADHKLAEKALRQEQQFSKAVINSLPGIFFLYSYPECRLLLWNKQHEELLGYSFEELNGRYVSDFHSPEVKDAVMNAIEAMMKAGQGSVEDVLVTKDGRPIPFFSTAVKFESQGKSYFMGICTDMTAHKRAEAELHEARRRQDEIIEHLPDATFVIDADRKVVAWNRAIEEMTGILKEEMIGKGNYEYAIPFYGERRPILIDMAFLPDEEFEKREYDVVRRIADTLYGEVYVPKTYGGKGAYLSATASRLRNAAGNVTGAIECIRDITERKHFEKTLRENEEKFSKAFHTSPYAITITSPKDGKFVDVNEGFILITGFTREEALADSSIGLKLWVNEDDRQRVVADLRAGRAVVGQEIHFRTKSDEIITGLFSAQTIQLSSGPCILSSINDISERKRAGEEKAKLEGQLQQAQKMESVGRLAGGVAHDFNNLLGVILGHAEMALDRVDQAETVYADLEEILKAANRSADLTRQLLAFARQQVVAPKVLDLNDTVEGMLKLLRRLIGEDINLSWQPGASLWPIKIDPSQIDQILANICVNARDAISDVGRMTIETENCAFDNDYCADHAGFVPGEYVRLTLSDDGCGMNKETLSHLFEPFFTTKGVGKGTGLGLATVYGIVKQNNGFINVYSEEDQGTTFKIYLPRHVGKTTQMQKEAPTEPVARGHETILLVEDEKTLLDLSKRMLEKQGYRVLTAGTPGEAIRLAEEKAGEIQLLMTDVVMPEMNGRDLAKKMLTLYPNLKCLFTSGYTANVIVHHGVLDEGVYFIQKPFSIKELGTKVREALDQE
jgi:PAS domain S-box-containing protein